MSWIFRPRHSIIPDDEIGQNVYWLREHELMSEDSPSSSLNNSQDNLTNQTGVPPQAATQRGMPANLQATYAPAWNVMPSWRPSLSSSSLPPYGYYPGYPMYYRPVAATTPVAPPPSMALDDGAVPPWKRPQSHQPSQTKTAPRPSTFASAIKFNVAAAKTPIPVTPATKSMAAVPQEY